MQELIKIMTYNVRIAVDSDPFRWQERREAILKVIERYAPDIISMQEARDHMYEFFINELKEYDTYGVNSMPGTLEGQSNPIFIRKDKFQFLDRNSFMLSETPHISASKSWDTACERICSYAQLAKNGRDEPFIRVYSTHLDHVSQWARQEGLRLIMKTVKEENKCIDLPFIVLGDFNDTFDSPIHDEMKDAVSCYTVIKEDKDNLLTFHGYSDRTEGEPIDYIYAGNNAEFTDCIIIRDKINEVMPSDHHPVMATLKVNIID